MGASLVIDIYVMFLWKSILRIFWLLKSSKWDRIAALLVYAGSSIPDWGCPVVNVSYKLASQDTGFQQGTTEIPFIFRGSAEHYARKFSEERPVTVRVDPKNPKRTLLFGHDQKFVRQS